MNSTQVTATGILVSLVVGVLGCLGWAALKGYEAAEAVLVWLALMALLFGTTVMLCWLAWAAVTGSWSEFWRG